MDKALSVLVVGTLLIVGGTPAFADEGKGEVAASEAAGATIRGQGTAHQMGRKLNRGLVNVSTGWVELPKVMYAINQEWGPIFGVLASADGLERSAVRTLGGVYEVVTFPVPLPAGYASIVKPRSAFTWARPSLGGFGS